MNIVYLTKKGENKYILQDIIMLDVDCPSPHSFALN